MRDFDRERLLLIVLHIFQLKMANVFKCKFRKFVFVSLGIDNYHAEERQRKKRWKRKEGKEEV